MAKFPQRTNTHILETESERYFTQSLPPEWTSERPDHDYGIDQRVEISHDGSIKGYEFLVQLKSSAISEPGEIVTTQLAISTYHYLWDKLQVVMLIKYIQSEKEAYWILLCNVPDPDDTHKTMTIHIPKANTLSTIDWNRIRKYVEQVTYKKISAREKDGFDLI